MTDEQRLVVAWVDVEGLEREPAIEKLVTEALEIHKGGQYKSAVWSSVADLYLTGEWGGGVDLSLTKSDGMREHLGGTDLWGGYGILEEDVKNGPLTFRRVVADA